MNKKVVKTVFIIFAWLFIWQVASELADLDLILASPVKVMISLIGLLKTKLFYQAMAGSFLKITAGFVFAFLIGIVLAALAKKTSFLKDFLSPLVYLMKALPVASFIIMVLIWTGSKYLSVVISFIVVFPMIYLGTLEGISNLDFRLLEMAKVYRIGNIRKIRYIYAPQIFPFVVSSCKIALGMCWKAGISAEVIGLPSRSIGQQMYLSKIYLMADELLAWSAAIIIVSVIFEKLFLFILNCIRKGLEK